MGNGCQGLERVLQRHAAFSVQSILCAHSHLRGADSDLNHKGRVNVPTVGKSSC